MAVLDSVTLPAGAALDMAPGGTDVMVRGDARWRAGDRVPFVLHFERGGSITVEAVVIRPGTRLTPSRWEPSRRLVRLLRSDVDRNVLDSKGS